jgi:hypothetical protein
MISISQITNFFQDLPLAILISENEFLFPWLESFHVLAITMVIGSIFLVDFRLTGIAFRNFEFSTFSKALIRITWLGFGLAVITGSLMFISNASTYLNNTAFQLKFLFLGLAGVNMVIFQFISSKEMNIWGHPYGRIPPLAKLAGICSLSFWLVVVACGRWIGFSL